MQQLGHGVAGFDEEQKRPTAQSSVRIESSGLSGGRETPGASKSYRAWSFSRRLLVSGRAREAGKRANVAAPDTRIQRGQRWRCF